MSVVLLYLEFRLRSCVSYVTVIAPVSVNIDNNGKYHSRNCKRDHVYTKRRQCRPQNSTVNSEVFARILFSRMAFKGTFSMLKIPRFTSIRKDKVLSPFARDLFSRNSASAKFRENKPSRKFPNLQYETLVSTFLEIK